MVVIKAFDDQVFDGAQMFDVLAPVPTKGNVVIATADFDPLPIEVTVGG